MQKLSDLPAGRQNGRTVHCDGSADCKILILAGIRGRSVGDDVQLEVGELFSELGNQLRQNTITAVIALALLVASDLVLNRVGKSSSAFISSLVEMGVNLYVLRAALRKANLLPSGSKPKFWSFFWMCLMSGLGILAACVLLVLPGLYLLARWFVAGPILVAEDSDAIEALRESWYRTKLSVWHLVAASLVLFGGGSAIAFIPHLIIPVSEQGLWLDAVSSVAQSAAYICGWLMEVGAYAMLVGKHRALAEVFA